MLVQRKQHTVTREKKETELIARGRHDPCVVPRGISLFTRKDDDSSHHSDQDLTPPSFLNDLHHFFFFYKGVRDYSTKGRICGYGDL